LARDHRRLAAIVSADVVGYSLLMGRDDSATLAGLKAHRRELIDPKISEYDGRIVKTTGDGLLMEFPSVVEAVRCAVDVQRGMAERNAGVPAEERIEFRIGINVGDIIIDGDDIYGDGVNVAARLQALAEPGGICVSKAVRDQVLDKLSFAFEELGAQQVKNIVRPIEVYRIRDEPAAAAAIQAQRVADRGRLTPDAAQAPPAAVRKFARRQLAIVAGILVLLLAVGVGTWQWTQRQTATVARVAGPPPRSMMVLAFSAPADDAQLIKLADTLSGDVARALANSIRDANIVASSDAAATNEKPVDEHVLGRAANVRYILSGDVNAAGDDIAVTARLVDSTSAKLLGSERRTIARARMSEDHDLLVARVTAAGRDMFQSAEGRRIAAEPLLGTDAQSLVARADAIMAGDDLASARAARKLYEQARERDPSLVSAWLGHINTLSAELSDPATGRNEALIAEMDRDSLRAIALDDRDPRVWQARVEALYARWQWAAAFEAIDRAIALDPSRIKLQLYKGELFIVTGRVAEGLQQISKYNTMAGSPDSTSLLMACHAHVHLGQYEEAISECERAVAGYRYDWVYLDLMAAYAATGDMTRAKAAKAQLMNIEPGFTISRFQAKQLSDNPVWIEQINTRFIPGWRKAGVPE